LGALLSASRLLVCNDTGVSHLADALNVPSVVIFTASDVDRWAPKDKDLHRILTQAAMVEPQAVLHEVKGLLREERIHAYS
jgi:ADP-heptose:LPS heptosyltransferase